MVYHKLTLALVVELILFSLVALPLGAHAQTATDVICTGCVGTTDLANVGVTSAKLGNSVVTTLKILNGTIADADISTTAAIDPSKISGTAWTANNDGSASTLDAHYLDGLTSSQFLRADQSGNFLGTLTIGGGNIAMDSNYGLTWGSDGDTEYINRVTGVDALAFGTQNTQRLLIDSYGRIGIGTGSPSYTLDVNSQSVRIASNDYDGITFEKQAYPNQGTLLFSSDRSGYNFSIGNKRQSDGNVLPIITMSDTGNVGIGTTSPENKLEIESGNIGMDSDYGLVWGSGADAEYVRRPSGVDSLTLGTQNTERIRIDASGNVGIGTASPSHTLQVSGPGGGTMLLSTTDSYGPNVTFGGGTSFKLLATNSADSAGNNKFILSNVGSSNLLTVDYTGNVGIGTSAPTQKLDVQGNIVATGTICGSAGCVGDSSGSSQWTTAGSNIYYSSGNVGIGTTSPTAGLHVASNDGVLLTGTIGSGSIPTTGAGTRMMWYPAEAAWRAGTATGTEWDSSSIGYYSTATGYSTKASGVSAVAMGDSNIATGDYSAAFGSFTDATGRAALATGYSTAADGSYSATFNRGTDANAQYATAFGDSTTAESYASVVLGRYNESQGDNSTWIETDPLFVIGNGSSSGSRNNAFVVYKDGDVEVSGDITSDGEICIGSGC